MNTCHDLDLSRCYSPRKYQNTVIDTLYHHSQKNKNPERQIAFANLIGQAQQLLLSSGEALNTHYSISPKGTLLPAPSQTKNIPLFFDILSNVNEGDPQGVAMLQTRVVPGLGS